MNGSASGQEITRVLSERARENPRIALYEGEGALELWRSDERCLGVLTERRPVAARATILATGGVAALWERTTNPSSSVGEGVAMAYRAGAALADLEFVQFHPTALAGSSLLLTEAMRGEGARLLDDEGRRFIEELAPRDVVARAVAARGTALLPRCHGSAREPRLRPRFRADSGRGRVPLHDWRRPHRPGRAH